MGYRYRFGMWVIDMGYGIDMGIHPPYRYGHPGYRYGIWANETGDDGIATVILDIDMGYLVTLVLVLNDPRARCPVGALEYHTINDIPVISSTLYGRGSHSSTSHLNLSSRRSNNPRIRSTHHQLITCQHSAGAYTPPLLSST